MHWRLLSGGTYLTVVYPRLARIRSLCAKKFRRNHSTMHSARIFTKWPTTLLHQLRRQRQPILRQQTATPMQAMQSHRTLATRATAMEADVGAVAEMAGEEGDGGGVVIRREGMAPRVRDRRRAGARRAAPNGRKWECVREVC